LWRQPCFRLLSGTADCRGPFGSWPGWVFSTCRTMLRLGVFDDAFLYGFVLVGSFVFCYKGICMDHPCIQL
jgi:hypothetical protein